MPFAWGRKRSFEPLRHHGVERLYPLIEFQLYREIKARDVSDQSLQAINFRLLWPSFDFDSTS
jgi:hypothetical protein